MSRPFIRVDTMNVILTSNIIIDGRFFKAGKAVELSESDAKALIDNKLAYSDAPKVEEVKPTVAPKATLKKTTSKGAKWAHLKTQ